MGNHGVAQMNFAEKLASLRAELSRLRLDGFLVPRGDEHLSEYVPACAERLAWLTGFTGSAGMAAVLADRAAIWSDGRYVLQLSQETDGTIWERRHLTEHPLAKWLKQHAGPAARIGYDPWLMPEDAVKRLKDTGLTLVPVPHNPIDAVWQDRPAPPPFPAEPHGLKYAGLSSAEKRAQIAKLLQADGQDAAVLTDPASLAWLLNIRGADVPFTPFALGFGIIHEDAAAELFMAPEKLPTATREWLGNGVSVTTRDALPGALTALAGKRVRVDEAAMPAWFGETLRTAGAVVANAPDPCLVPKARKNSTEQAGARAAHAKDAVALCRFLHWASTAAGHATELSAGAALLAFRERGENFRGESFPAILGAGEHGAIIHYRVTPATDRAINANEVFLVDSGGQYTEGTTDVTRTIWTGPDAPPRELRDQFTRVLQGHIAMATLIFPENVAGVRLDAFARAALWQVGLDYDHGTGHGVGSFLSVHEGPISISPYLRPAPLEEGMILSNEPGFYLPGQYGIRLENLLLVREASLRASKKFFDFETLTLAPFERTLILPELLSVAERAWVDAYHARVLAEIGPHLPADAGAWLTNACAPLGGQ
jgi:Xaa-Pro aminopeptidase